MPAPVIVGVIVALALKLAKFIYFGKFGIYPLWRSIKEYRRRHHLKQINSASAPIDSDEIGFFAAPLQALRDRHFWVRFLVHAAAILTFAPAIVKGLYARVSRKTQGAFVTGYPCCREREQKLIGRLLDKPWREVLINSFDWVCLAWRSQGACSCVGQLIIREPIDGSSWYEVHFEGRVVLINPTKWLAQASQFELLEKVLAWASVNSCYPSWMLRVKRRQQREKFRWPEGIMQIKRGVNNSVLITTWERKSKRIQRASLSLTQAVVIAQADSLVTGSETAEITEKECEGEVL